MTHDYDTTEQVIKKRGHNPEEDRQTSGQMRKAGFLKWRTKRYICLTY
jgi:hypothetical protein